MDSTPASLYTVSVVYSACNSSKEKGRSCTPFRCSDQLTAKEKRRLEGEVVALLFSPLAEPNMRRVLYTREKEDETSVKKTKYRQVRRGRKSSAFEKHTCPACLCSFALSSSRRTHACVFLLCLPSLRSLFTKAMTRTGKILRPWRCFAPLKTKYHSFSCCAQYDVCWRRKRDVTEREKKSHEKYMSNFRMYNT